MSGDNVAEVTQEAAPADEGPREIVFAQQEEAAPAQEAEPAPEADAVGLEEEAPQPQEKPRTSMQERMDEITRARREAEREAEYWKARAKAYDQPQKADPTGRPLRDAYGSDEEYQEALVDWKVDQRLSKKDAESAAQKAGEERATSWNTKLEAARAEFADHQAVLDSCDRHVHMHVSDALLEHEHGAKVAYELAKNPDLIDKLNGMSATQAAFEVAKIGAKFDKAPEAAPSPKPAAVSKAPAPAASKVGSNRSTATSPEDMTMAEYAEWRKKNGAY